MCSAGVRKEAKEEEEEDEEEEEEVTLKNLTLTWQVGNERIRTDTANDNARNTIINHQEAIRTVILDRLRLDVADHNRDCREKEYKATIMK